MDTTIFEFGKYAAAAVPIVIGLVQAAKAVGLNSRYAAFVSIFCGIALMFIVGVVWQIAIVQGIIIGLASAGLYSGGKAFLA